MLVYFCDSCATSRASSAHQLCEHLLVYPWFKESWEYRFVSVAFQDLVIMAGLGMICEDVR